MDSSGNWWFVWILYRDEIRASIGGLSAMLRLAREQPSLFGANADTISQAHHWDQTCGETDFEIPDAGSEGNDPTYVLCSILALRRLLNTADSHGLPVVHMQYSFRVR